jgi:hypothetical protein
LENSQIFHKQTIAEIFELKIFAPIEFLPLIASEFTFIDAALPSSPNKVID